MKLILYRGSDVEYLAQLSRDGAVVRVGRHDLAHVLPPATTDLRLRDGGPARLVLDLDVAEQIARVRVEKNRVLVHAVGDQRQFELVPNRLMPPLVFRFRPGIDGHSKGFADHGCIIAWTVGSTRLFSTCAILLRPRDACDPASCPGLHLRPGARLRSRARSRTRHRSSGAPGP